MPDRLCFVLWAMELAARTLAAAGLTGLASRLVNACTMFQNISTCPHTH